VAKRTIQSEASSDATRSALNRASCVRVSKSRAGFILRDSGFGPNLILTVLIAGGVAMSAIIAKEIITARGQVAPMLSTQRVALEESASLKPVEPAEPLPPESPVTIARGAGATTQSTSILAASNDSPGSAAVLPSQASVAAPPTMPTLAPGTWFEFGHPDFIGPPPPSNLVSDPSLRWFNGRPVRPAKVLWMTVTAYSPDWRSCGDSADGRTATMHCVTTNAHLLIAADPEVLAYGSMLTVPGYGLPLETKPRASGTQASAAPSNDASDTPATLLEEPIVPVLDCGGAIKGFRLDLLYPTHEEARVWGVRFVPVTVWEYADGKPRPNPRRLR